MRRLPYVILSFAIAGEAVAQDLSAKAFFFSPGTRPLFFISPAFVRLTDHANLGLPFDLPFPFLLLIALHALVLVLVAAFFLSARPSRVRAICFGLIVGGAIGNFYDRLFLGFVRDWLLFFGRSAINLADFFIAFGVLLFLLRGLREPDKRH